MVFGEAEVFPGMVHGEFEGFEVLKVRDVGGSSGEQNKDFRVSAEDGNGISA